MKTRTIIPVVLALATSFLLSSCGPNLFFEESKQLGESWDYNQPISYQVEIDDTLQVYNLVLDIEHTTTYLYQNLYVQLETTFPGNEKTTQEVSFNLANKAGRWFGDCCNETCNLSLLIQKNAFFNKAGSYTFTFHPYMRKNPIEGINRLTFSIEKTDQKRSQ